MTSGFCYDIYPNLCYNYTINVQFWVALLRAANAVSAPLTIAGREIGLALEHHVKTLLVFSILFSAIAGFPALCQTPQSAIETDSALIKTEIAVIKTEIKNLNEKIDDKFESIEKNFDRQNNIIIACIGIPLAILAIGGTVWGILAHRRSGKDQTLEKRIETLTQEIETLKQQKIVSP